MEAISDNASSDEDSLFRENQRDGHFSDEEVKRLLYPSRFSYIVIFFTRIPLFIGTIFVHILSSKTYLSSSVGNRTNVGNAHIRLI